MMRKWIISAVVASALSACSSGAAQVDDVRAALEAELRDYPGTRFQNVRITKDDRIICGELNTPTIGGGQEGWRAFSGLRAADGVTILIGDEPGSLGPGCGAAEADFRPDDYAKAVTY
jgi:hypothetical protein